MFCCFFLLGAVAIVRCGVRVTFLGIKIRVGQGLAARQKLGQNRIKIWHKNYYIPFITISEPQMEIQNGVGGSPTPT